MKESIKYCDNCKEDTRQRVKLRYSSPGKRDGFSKKREATHCTRCNVRTIKKPKTTYKKV